mgnify:CR=1 FL=1
MEETERLSRNQGSVQCITNTTRPSRYQKSKAFKTSEYETRIKRTTAEYGYPGKRAYALVSFLLSLWSNLEARSGGIVKKLVKPITRLNDRKIRIENLVLIIRSTPW